MSKTKVYFCTKTQDMKVCGETNPSQFVPGRYSTCKACRNKFVREYNKEKKFMASDDRKREIDPTANIRSLIVDTILNEPLLENKTIEEKVNGNEEDISDVLCTVTDQLEAFKKITYFEIGKLIKSIEELKKQNEDLTNEIKILKQKIL